MEYWNENMDGEVQDGSKKWESVVWEDRRHKAGAQRLIDDRKMEQAGDQQLIEDRKTEQGASLSQLSFKETLRCSAII